MSPEVAMLLESPMKLLRSRCVSRRRRVEFSCGITLRLVGDYLTGADARPPMGTVVADARRNSRWLYLTCTSETPMSVIPDAGAGGPLDLATRRGFLARTSALSLVVGGSALLGCRPGTDDASDTSASGSSDQRLGDQSFNANSRADTAVHRLEQQGASSAVPGSTAGAASTTRTRYDPVYRRCRRSVRCDYTGVRERSPCASATTPSSPRGRARATSLGRSCTVVLATRWTSRSRTKVSFRTRWTSTPHRSIPGGVSVSDQG